MPPLNTDNGGRGQAVAVGYAAKRWASWPLQLRGPPIFSACVRPMTYPRLCAKCHSLTFSPRFEVYSSISKEIRGIFAEYSPPGGTLSLDEAYLDVTENLRGLSTGDGPAKKIRARIFEQNGAHGLGGDFL